MLYLKLEEISVTESFKGSNSNELNWKFKFHNKSYIMGTTVKTTFGTV